MRIYNYYLFFILFVLTSFTPFIIPHGFSGNTNIKIGCNDGFISLEQIINDIKRNKKQYLSTYDVNAQTLTAKQVKSAAFSETNCYCYLSFADQTSPIRCTPSQLFYRVKDHQWVAAYMLRPMDKLLCAHNRTIQLADIQLIKKPLKVYIVEVKGTHTFLVGEQSIIAHNMLVPLTISIGLSIPFGCGGASVGSIFGPIGICGGVVLGGIVGCVINACVRERVKEYKLSFDSRWLTTFMESDKNDESSVKSVDDILEDTSPGKKTAGKAKQYIKTGGYEDAMKDFGHLGTVGVKKMKGKEGKTGLLPDGRKINVRKDSTEGRPTLEIQPIGGKGKVIKIRYENKN